MELKRARRKRDRRGLRAFNRTTMELKQMGTFARFTDFFTFNRTTMELKPLSPGHFIGISRLLIEPLWN